jgi:hypothetical protein
MFNKQQQAEYASKRYQERSDSGLCVYCGKNKARIGTRGQQTRSCEACFQKYKRDTGRLSKTWRDAKAAAGLCTHCGHRPHAEDRKLCSVCLAEMGARAARSYRKNPDRWNESSAVSYQKLKLEVFNAYGGPICFCCGETIVLLLSVDHINNDGAAHRRELYSRNGRSGGKKLYRWLKQNHFPPGFQVACFSCNMGRHLNGGVCPHKLTEVRRT